MKINLKARLKNKVFVLSASTLVISLIYQVLSIFDVVVPITESEISEAIAMLVNVLALSGVLVDPTTEGFNDSERAMTYCTACDVRKTEGEFNE